MFRVVIPLVGYEIKRNLRPSQALALLGFCMLLVWGYDQVYAPVPPEEAQVQGALTLHNRWLRLAIPLLAGAVGDSLADEQRKGITFTLLARGITRGQYLLSKILGAAASGAILTAAAVLGFYIIVGILWPWGRVHTEAFLVPPPGPLPALYTVNPLANDLLLASMAIVASGALSVVSVFTGTLTTNRYMAMVAPVLLFIASVVLHEYGARNMLNPYTYLDLRDYYTLTIPVPWRPYAAFLYWLCFSVVLAALSRWIFARKELT